MKVHLEMVINMIFVCDVLWQWGSDWHFRRLTGLLYFHSVCFLVGMVESHIMIRCLNVQEILQYYLRLVYNVNKSEFVKCCRELLIVCRDGRQLMIFVENLESMVG